MSIYFDNIIFSLQKAGGISVVWQNLLTEISKIGIDFYLLEYTGYDKNIFRQRLTFPPHRIKQRRLLLSKTIEQLVDVKLNSIKKPFIFHSSYYRLCSNHAAINVTTVHDFIYEKGFAKIGLPERIRLRLNYRAIQSSSQIVCISENTKRDLLTYVPDIDENKICVIYNGVSDEYKVLTEKLPLYNNYILFVGGRQKYKNFEFSVKAVQDTRYNLLICGNELTQNEKRFLDETIGPKRYLFKLRPSNRELNQIYNSVHCLLYLSSYEGFGIPILEAQRAGCPVIALNASSIPEVMGNGGFLLNKLDRNELIFLIKEIENSHSRQSIINSGICNSQKYSWSKMAHEYKNIYDRLLLK